MTDKPAPGERCLTCGSDKRNRAYYCIDNKCGICTNDWHSAEPAPAQPSQSPDHEVCTHQNGHGVWCNCPKSSAPTLTAECTEDCVRKGYSDPNCPKHGSPSAPGKAVKDFWMEYYKEAPSFLSSRAACEFAEAYAFSLRSQVEQPLFQHAVIATLQEANRKLAAEVEELRKELARESKLRSEYGHELADARRGKA